MSLHRAIKHPTKKPKTYIIAEAGVNHNGKKELAFALVDAAAEVGADAVKFQTFKAAKLASHLAKKASYQLANTSQDESQLAMLTQLELPEDWHGELKNYAQRLGVEFLSTAFDVQSLQFLQSLQLPMFKIPSGEITNAPLLWHFAKTGKPLILSTGMASLSDVELALAIIGHGLMFDTPPQHSEAVWQAWTEEDVQEKVKAQVILLHCTSQYPTPWQEVNLHAMTTLAQAFGMQVGYSDHTLGTVIPIAAVAQGACLIEKHITLDKHLPGPDHPASLDVEEFKTMVDAIRALELALGSGIKMAHANEWKMRAVARQSLVASQFIPLGARIEKEALTTARVGEGLSPALYWDVLGSVATKAYAPGDVI